MTKQPHRKERSETRLPQISATSRRCWQWHLHRLERPRKEPIVVTHATGAARKLRTSAAAEQCASRYVNLLLVRTATRAGVEEEKTDTVTTSLLRSGPGDPNGTETKGTVLKT